MEFLVCDYYIVTAMAPFAVNAGPLEDRNAAFENFYNKFNAYERAYNLAFNNKQDQTLKEKSQSAYNLAVEAARSLEKYANTQRGIRDEIFKRITNDANTTLDDTKTGQTWFNLEGVLGRTKLPY